MTWEQWCADRDLIRRTYADTHAGIGPDVDDVDIIRYRQVYERQRWPTIYHAMADLWNSPIPTPVHPDPLVGHLTLRGTAFVHAGGFVNPVFCHAGDVFSLYTRDAGWTERQLDEVARAGYHGLRVWTILHGPYWASKGREVNPEVTADYWDQWGGFCAAVAARRLRLVVSQGDLLRYLPQADGRERFFALLAHDPHTVYTLVDAGNETWQNGEDDPGELARVMRGYRDHGGQGLLALSSPPGEERADLEAYSRPPADLYDVHGYRGGHSWDKIRHIFSLGYEIMPGRVGIQSEPAGPGDLVSVTENKHELDAEALSLMGVMSVLANQAWVYFSGEGVSIQRGLETEPGFREVPAAIRALPPDVMRWERILHSGTTWAAHRVFSCDEPDVRIDGRICSDGRFVFVAYGPSGLHTVRVERACEVQAGTGEAWTLDPGATLTLAWTRGRVLQGRLR